MTEIQDASPAAGPTDSTEALLAAVDALLPEVSERAAEGERCRTMPPELVSRMEAAGIFRAQRVRALGGLEVDPPVLVDVIERLAHADGSAAWTALIGMSSAAFFGWLDPEVAGPMLAGVRDAAATCVIAPSGTAIPDGTGCFTVSGRWAFNSGIAHAAWRQVAVVVSDVDGPRTTPAGTPDMRIAFVPAADGEIVDTWDSMGLRGTGSHDLVLEGVTVPAERMFTLDGANRHQGDYARLPLFSTIQLGVIGFPLGIARRSIDEFVALAARKTRGAGARWAVADDSHVQAELGRAEGELAAARAFVDAAVASLWDGVRTTGEPTLEARLGVSLATQHAMRAAVTVTDIVFRHAGAGAIFTGAPLQRCFRDVHTASQHIFYAADVDRRHARLRLGFDEPTLMI